MAFYQHSVLNKYLAAQQAHLVKAGFERFRTYFLHAERQENIRNMKEEQFQEGFLRELFVNVLGYTINPEPGFNLTTELKNIKDAKKTDGAILKDGNALAVIELKGTDTKDLDKVSEQAFNYKNNQPECVYVVTSNFEKLRFYIHNAVEHEEFNLFNLTEERFALLWLFLQKDNLLGGIAQKVKEESLLEEKNITDRLYKDYSAFKQQLWQNMVQRNPQHDPLLLYKKSQKLLDRILFILFAEDKGLLPPNSIIQIVQHWEKLSELDEAKPLYYLFLKYFGYMDTGRKAQGSKAEIHAYNGGLFAPDELLDNLTLDDEVLQRHCLKLCTYNFESDVDTNILGHIFEHSLNDIEAVRAELAGEMLDQSKTKRKKDGVFYTPKYITKYIVENTVGRLCEEKKTAIGIDDEEFGKDRKGRKKETLKRLDDQLKTYRDWLLQLTICDPACGSGAFLNQALEFLMAEHRYVDELEAQLLGHSFEFPGVEAHILEHNIYGVDINEESVEIARLSLWLRTAQKGRKLTTLSSNIKVGNSLIDDPTVAGDLAFDWKKEFPKVFEKGGFDVVVGNPPYIKEHINKSAFDGLHGTPYYQGKMDLWTFFGCIGIDLLKPFGRISFIAPNSWVSNFGASIFRNKMMSDGVIENYVDFGDYHVFEEAGIQTMIYVYRKQEVPAKYNADYLRIISKAVSEFDVQSIVNDGLDSDIAEKYSAQIIPQELIDSNITFLDGRINSVTDKLVQVGNYRIPPEAIGNGIDVLQDFVNSNHLAKLDFPVSIGDGVLILSSTEIEKLGLSSQERAWLKPYFGTAQFSRYNKIEETDYYILYANADFRASINEYPKLKSHLDKFSSILTSAFAPYGLHRARAEKYFSEPAIYGHRKTMKPAFVPVDFPAYVTRSFLIVQPSDIPLNYLTAILNSRICYFWLKNMGKLQGSQLQIDKDPLTLIPIVKDESKYEIADNLVSQACSQNLLLHNLCKSVLDFIKIKLDLVEPSKSIKDWPTLDFKGFLAELKKAKVQMGLSEEAEWMTYFNEQKQKANDLQAEIDRLDREIDQMVYRLYELTEEEIKIVEGSNY